MFDRVVKLAGVVAGLLENCRREISCRGANVSIVMTFLSIASCLSLFDVYSRSTHTDCMKEQGRICEPLSMMPEADSVNPLR